MSRIDAITQPCFDAIVALRAAPPDSVKAAHEVYQSLRLHIDSAIGRALAAGFSKDEAHDIAFALVALADEVAMELGGAVGEYWSPRLLQGHHGGNAAEEFYRHLERWRRASPPRPELVRVYYVAMALGFHGRYGGGRAERPYNELMTALKPLAVAEATTKSVATAGTLRPAVSRQVEGNWAPFFVPIGAALASALLYYGLGLHLQGEAIALAGWITSLISSQ